MVLFENKKKCCGCAACYNVCPQKAIEMLEDEDGYLYPVINEEKCINCGICKKSCGYQNVEKKLYEPQNVYVAQTKVNEIITKSASGGIFAEIAKNIMYNNGVVYGAALIDNSDSWSVNHIRIDKIEDLSKIQGSKYVQSDIKDIYISIKKDLEKNRVVLFSGTPCQVYALKNYLGKKDYENLYMIDLICHGVPSNKMFNDYIKYLSKQIRGKIKNITFRDKMKKWGLNASIQVEKKGKVSKKFFPAYKSSYYQLFLDSIIYRKNCYECPFAQRKRCGDITIGDYWNVENEHKEYLKKEIIDIKQGVSCIIVNNIKGHDLIKKNGFNIKMCDSTFDKVSRNNSQLLRPSKYNYNRDKVLELYKKGGYCDVERWYQKHNFIKNTIKPIYYILLKVVKMFKK